MPAGPTHTVVSVTTAASLAATFGTINETSTALEAARLFFAGGGTDALIVRTESASIEDLCGVEHLRTGLWALLDHDVHMISVPDTRDLSLSGADTVYGTAIEIAHTTDSLFLLDPPALLDNAPAHLDEWLPIDQNTAVYLPYLKRRDPLAGCDAELALSGSIAAAIATSEQNFGAWTSPSGADASIATGDWELAYEHDGARRIELRRLGINVARRTSDPVIWGSRTLMARGAITADEKYVSVSRTASMLRRSIQKGIEWAMVEPNDQALWDTITADVTVFLDSLWRQGAFAGTGEGSSYFVQCDESTMRVPPGGIPKILIGFAPIDAGQFVPVDVAFPTPRWLV